VPWFLPNFIRSHGLGMDGWYPPCIFRHFSFFVWVVYLSELVKYSLIECYLAAKVETISSVLVWWVFFITCD
jgi:hypothetical protein